MAAVSKKREVSRMQREFILNHRDEPARSVAREVKLPVAQVRDILDALPEDDGENLMLRGTGYKTHKGTTAMTEAAAMAGNEADSGENKAFMAKYAKDIFKMKRRQ